MKDNEYIDKLYLTNTMDNNMIPQIVRFQEMWQP